VSLSNCWSFCHLCQCIPYAGYSSVQFVASKRFCVHHKSCLLLPVDGAYLLVHTHHVYLQTIVIMSSLVLDQISPRFSRSFG
jgi:hypothetical protein